MRSSHRPVQCPQPAPQKTLCLLAFLVILSIGKSGLNGEQQRSYQPRNQDHLFPTRSRALMRVVYCVGQGPALQWRACPPSPAAGQKTPARNAGTSIAVTCASERLRSAPAIQPTPIRGPGAVASIRAAIQGNRGPARRPASMRHASPLKARGACSSPSAPRLTFRPRAIIATGSRADMRCGNAASRHRRKYRHRR
jgi:hypothetical protein